MKMVKCKKCGYEYQRKINRCPECKTRTPISKGRKITGIIIGILGILMIFSIAVNWEESSTDLSSTPDSSSAPTVNSQQEENKSNNTESLVYSDSNIKVSFIKVADAADVGVTACYIYLKVENISTQTFTVSLSEAYANDSAVTVMSAVPMTLAPGKNSKQPFMFGYNNILTSADEVEKLEFKITLFDKDYSIIETTKTITVNVK